MSLILKLKSGEYKKLEHLTYEETKAAISFNNNKKKIKEKQQREFEMQILDNNEMIDRLHRKNEALRKSIDKEIIQQKRIDTVLSGLEKQPYYFLYKTEEEFKKLEKEQIFE